MILFHCCCCCCCQVTSVVSDSVQPHRQQPTRLPRPWDSPGKNTGVDCHFLLQCMKVKSESEVSQLCPTLSDPMDCSLPGSSIHGIFQARVLEWGAIAFSQQLLPYLFLTCPTNKSDISWLKQHNKELCLIDLGRGRNKKFFCLFSHLLPALMSSFTTVYRWQRGK